jgi:hypothetical protein
MTKRRDAEDRRQQQLRRLGTQHPCCTTCAESDPVTLERHHIAGRKNHDDEAIVCANCHRKLSNKQRSHAPTASAEPAGKLGRIGHYLLGLADLFAMIVETLRKFGAWLIAESQRPITA